ncbi:bile acid:sodium symporter family protein [Salipaludibacillus sp. CF4.18]|uniref:bile acid:sodium symporter family protein n=1 Tax=Salipaludibacillus sp. CF4.18 TaxID=3373081 RepID=UPI003EE6F717
MDKVNLFLNERMAIVTPIVLFVGISASSWIGNWTFIVPWLFMIITFASSTKIAPMELVRTIRSPLPIILCIIALQIIVPLLAYGIGSLFFSDDPMTLVGIVLAFIIPTAIASLLWVSIYKGDTSLALTIVFINTLAAPIFIPITLYLLFQTSVSFDIPALVWGLIQMIVIPSILGILVNHFTGKEFVNYQISLDLIAKFCLLTVILINGSVVAPYFIPLQSNVVIITGLIFLISVIAYMIGFVLAKLFKFSFQKLIAVMFCTGMRNIGVGSALAVVYFPAAVALPVVIGTLFQQLLASFMGKALIKFSVENKIDSKKQ